MALVVKTAAGSLGVIVVCVSCPHMIDADDDSVWLAYHELAGSGFDTYYQDVKVETLERFLAQHKAAATAVACIHIVDGWCPVHGDEPCAAEL